MWKINYFRKLSSFHFRDNSFPAAWFWLHFYVCKYELIAQIKNKTEAPPLQMYLDMFTNAIWKHTNLVSLCPLTVYLSCIIAT